MIDTDSFIIEARVIHGDKYDYSRVNYINSQTKVEIICPKHGVFLQKPNKHVHMKHGCPYCSGVRSAQQFIDKAKVIHDNKYDYSKVCYINSTTKVTIICPKHGEFIQSPHGHLKGYGCAKCSKNYRIGSKSFIDRACDVHGNRYDYSKVEYETNKKKVEIICKTHGVFEQLPSNHLYNKNGCPYCIDQCSIGQSEIISFLENNGFTVSINDRKIIAPNELDIYINSHELAIEYNGMYFHSFNRLENNKERNYHKNKCIKCKDNGIKLVQILESEWLYSNEVVKSILLNKLGRTNYKIYARKCSVLELSSKSFNDFCDSNHLQKSLNTKFRYCLMYDNDIVMVMGFNNHNKYDFVCTRLCTRIGHSVVGGASKLFKYFVSKFNKCSILTYADARYSNGDVYKNLGFVYDGHTKPNYFYVKGNRLFNRISFQKHKLSSKLSVYDPTITESENMFNNGYRRLWDAGHIRFVYYK